MNQDDLDKILISDERIEPSSSFAEDVMGRIQAEALSHDHNPFPWIRFAGLIFVLTILAVNAFPADLFVHTMNSMTYAIGRWIIAPSDLTLRNALLSALASIMGILVLVWFSLRLVGNRP